MKIGFIYNGEPLAEDEASAAEESAVCLNYIVEFAS